MNNLGDLYAKGNGIPQDYEQAGRLFEKAAAAGNALAMNNLGILYENGWGVVQDKAQARAWLEKAAARGNDEAKLELTKLPQ